MICHAAEFGEAMSIAAATMLLGANSVLGGRTLADVSEDPNAPAAPVPPPADDSGTTSRKTTIIIASVVAVVIVALLLYGCIKMWRSGYGSRVFKPRCEINQVHAVKLNQCQQLLQQLRH